MKLFDKKITPDFEGLRKCILRDWSTLDWLEKELPENMKCYFSSSIGFYKKLLEYEDMLYMVYDKPSLMKAVFEKMNDFFGLCTHRMSIFMRWGYNGSR